jgi:YD repeat-containing protein
VTDTCTEPATLTNRWSAAKGTTYYSYDSVVNLTSINYPASADVTLQYDWLNRLTNMVEPAGTTKYSYTAGSQLLTEAEIGVQLSFFAFANLRMGSEKKPR